MAMPDLMIYTVRTETRGGVPPQRKWNVYHENKRKLMQRRQDQWLSTASAADLPGPVLGSGDLGVKKILWYLLFWSL